jgi:hypothetical protein
MRRLEKRLGMGRSCAFKLKVIPLFGFRLLVPQISAGCDFHYRLNGGAVVRLVGEPEVNTSMTLASH